MTPAVDSPSAGPFRRALARLLGERVNRWSLAFLGALVLASLTAPLWTWVDPNATALDQRLLTPLSGEHLLGTDALGRDLLSRALFGLRLSLGVALLGVFIAALSGGALGLLAAYFRGWVDVLSMRGVDVLMAFPYLLLALTVVAVLGPGLLNAGLAIAIVNVPFFARTVRGQALGIIAEPYVDAARLGGLSAPRVLLGEILPGVLPVLLVAVSTSLGWMLVETAGLSFLGLGAQPPTADLGGMLGQSRHLLTIAPHACLVPGLAIVLVVAVLNLLGDGVRDALEPGVTAFAESTWERLDGSEPSGVDVGGGVDAEPARAPERALLCVRDLSVEIAGRRVVDSLSFELSPGERVALVGESGSGKSVTARSIMGLLPSARVRARELRLDSLDLRAPARLAPRPRVGWIPQDPMTSLHPMYRVRRQLGDALCAQGPLPAAERDERAMTLLADVNIGDPARVLHAYPHELSGGMRQRVVIAMALALSPRLLVADEPTTALDVTTQAQVLEELSRLTRARGAALLFITHDLAIVSRLCSRTLVMKEGRLVEAGETRTLLTRPEQSYTRRLLESIPELHQPEKILGEHARS